MRTALTLVSFLFLAAAEPPAEGLNAVTFHEAIAHAMAFESTASQAGLAVADAQAARLAARSALSPNVYLLGTYTRLDHDRGLSGGKLLASKDQINGQLNAIVPVIHGRRWADFREGGQQVQVAQRNYRDAQRTAAIAAAAAYLDVVTSKRQITVADQAVETGEAHYAIAQDRYRSGIGNRLDVLRADDALGESQVLQQTSLANVVASMERLGVVMGRNAPADVAEEWPERLDVSHDLAKDQGDHLYDRSDVALAYSQLLYAQQVRRDSWLDYVPNLIATGQFFGQDPPTTNYPHQGWQVQGLLTVPLFENGLRKGLREQRHANEHRAHLAFDRLERQARADARSSRTTLLRAENAVRAAQRRSQAAGENVALTARAYQRGTITSLEVVDAERRGRDAATAAAAAEDAVRRARLNFLVALGLFPASQLPVGPTTQAPSASSAPSAPGQTR